MRTSSLTWVNGKFQFNGALPLPDRGLDFGDGLFETLLLASGKPLYLDLHQQRLKQGLTRLGFPDCLATIRRYIESISGKVVDAGWSWASMRVTVTRGGAPRGYAIPEECKPHIIVTISKLDRDPSEMLAPAALCIADIRGAVQPFLAGLKHLNRLEQVMAATQARRDGVDEALMLAADERVVSVSSGNLFALYGSTLRTPAQTDFGIAGTRRRLVMESWAGQLGLKAEEGDFPFADLLDADEVFYSNALVGLRPVSVLGDTRWRSHAVCHDLFSIYRRDLL